MKFQLDGNSTYSGWSTTISSSNIPTTTATSNSPVGEGNSIVLNSTGCNSYQWNWPSDFTNNQAQNTILKASPSHAGTYFVTVSSSSGCSSMAGQKVQIIPSINATITRVENALIAKPAQASYQWFNCSTQQIIPGKTNHSLISSTNGQYAVIVILNGCAIQPSAIIIKLQILMNFLFMK